MVNLVPETTLRLHWTWMLIILTLLVFMLQISAQSPSHNQDLDIGLNYDYVDPYDMGTYSHSSRTNRPHPKSAPSGIQERIIKNTRAFPNYIETAEEIIKYSNGHSQQKPQFAAPVGGAGTEQNHSQTRTIKYFQRVIASIIHQLNLRGKTFGPRESITIDLQAEISYENYLLLNQFSLSSPDDPDVTRTMVSIDEIISNLLRVVQPADSLGTREYLKELLIFHVSNLWNFKAWLTVVSLTAIGVIIATLCAKIVGARSDLRLFLSYFFLLFLVLSCCWSYAERYETVKAQNVAKLKQYGGLPRDCNWNDLSSWESIKYFFRVKIARYPDHCEDYYKEELMDAFYLASPVEAISDTFSKLIFHPMEYIGVKLGKFFGGLVSAVPFWLQPFLLILVFVFLFLACFRYKISSPFISIEPSYAPRLHGPQHQQCGAVLEKPPREIVPLVQRDAWTSTDDLEDYIRSNDLGHDQQQQFDHPESFITRKVKRAFLCVRDFIRILLIDIPNIPPNENDIDEDEEFWNRNPNRPILPQPAEEQNFVPDPGPKPSSSNSKAHVFKDTLRVPNSIQDNNDSLPEGFDELLDLDMESDSDIEHGPDHPTPKRESSYSAFSHRKKSSNSYSFKNNIAHLSDSENENSNTANVDSSYASFCDLNLSDN